jgi:1-acyl-sn-glycerol-3-phosphate acyltransferase
VPAETKLDRSIVELRVLDAVQILLEDLGKHRSVPALGLDASLEKGLGLGSLERVELISRLESAFSVELPEAVLAQADTPEDLVEALLSGSRAPSPGGVVARTTSAGLPPPTSARTLVEALAARAEAEPDRPHIYLKEDGGEARTIRYGELFRDALGVAGGLAAEGIEPEDTVALMMPTCRDFFVAFAGVLLAGGVPVPLYPPFRMDRLEEYASRQVGILANAETRTFITVARGRSMGGLLRSRVPELRSVTTVEELLSRALPAPEVSLGAESPALIQYTSGSTGNPKGVLLTHRNLLSNVRAIGRALDIQGTDVGVSWLPLYHDMGLIGCWLTPLYYGIPMAIMSPLAFLTRPERWLWTIHAHRATLSVSPNFGYELCVRKIRREALEGLDLSCWRSALNGSESVSPDTLKHFEECFAPYGFRPEAMMPVYGLAESSVALAAPPLGRAARIEEINRELFEKEGRAQPDVESETSPLRFVSVGRPIEGHEVRIVDDGGSDLPERSEGVLEFRGPSTMKGYFRRPDETREVMRPGGWVSSGDRAYLADGEIFITGRAKDIIIRAGRNIYPQEVEEIIADVDGIRRGCVAAFGIIDKRQGTEKMVVVAETRAEEESEKARMESAIQEKLSELFGSPADDVVLVAPGAIPKTSSGKLRRSACRDRYLEGDFQVKQSRGRSLMLEIGLHEAAGRARRWLEKCGRAFYGSYVVLLSGSTLLTFWLLALAIPSRRLVNRAVRLGARAYIGLSGCRLRVNGLEHLHDLSGGASVLVSNHASYLDPLPLMATLPLDYAFVVKREAASWPIIGTFVRRLGYLSVERIDPQGSVSSAEKVGDVLQDGRSVFFFPEGTFTYASGLRPFKLGAFKLAAESGRPVIPLALLGTRHWLRDRTWLPRRSDLKIVVEKPLYPSESSLSEVVRLRDGAADAIARHVGEPRLDIVAAGLPTGPE